MAVNLIVLAVTLLMAAYLGVWIFCPRLRTWMEMPKHRFQERQRQFQDHPAGKTDESRPQPN